MHTPAEESKLTRRHALRLLGAGGAAVLAAGTSIAPQGAAAESSGGRTSNLGSLHPVQARAAILETLQREPLVALCERHMLQEWHDVLQSVLAHPTLSSELQDIVVEYGNAGYQSLCDRFILNGEAVPREQLVQIWRQIGDPTWNAPVYEQFYRTVRAVNRTRPASRRIRVLLGQAPVSMSYVAGHPADHASARALAAPMDDHFARLVKQEVLSRGRRALLIAGKGHLLRNLATDRGSKSPNAITQLLRDTRAKPYVIDNLLLPPGPAPDAEAARVAQQLARTPWAGMAKIPDTWLGVLATTKGGGWLNELADRALARGDAVYQQQADAVLYLGPGSTLTSSQPDPAIYHWSDYPQQLQRAATLAGAGNQLALGIRWATTSPGYFNLFQ